LAKIEKGMILINEDKSMRKDITEVLD